MTTKGKTVVFRRALSAFVSLTLLWGLAPSYAWAESAEDQEGMATNVIQEVATSEPSAQTPSSPNTLSDVVSTTNDDAATQTALPEATDDATGSADLAEAQEVEVAPASEASVGEQESVVEVQEAGKANNAADEKASAAGSALTTQSEQPLANVAIKARAHVARLGWLKWQSASEVTIGATDKSRRLEAFRLSCPGGDGSIVYSAHVQRRGWMAERKDGQMAGTTGKSLRVEAVKIRLTGKLEERYDVWYRVRVADSGWLGWTCNGSPAGTQGHGRAVFQLQVALVAKGAGQPNEPSDFELAFAKGQDIYNIGVERLSGDMAFDKSIDWFVRHKTGWGEKGLRRAYQIISTYEYEDQEMFYEGRMADKWSKRIAKEMYNKKRGNCYRYAALMCWVARRLGYDAKTISGHHFSASHQWLPHGWCEITLDGKKYVIDPLYHKRFPNKKFYMVTYDKTPFKYYTKK